MTIYRGPGGGGNADSDAEINALTLLSNQAEAAAEAAETSATAASASASSAATSASNAATSATNAGNSATAASDSASAAATSASSAAASYDSFDDRYLGAKSSAPTLDNDGDALLTGALYWNTTTSNLWVWTGSAWAQSAFSSSDFVTLTGNQTIDGVKTFSSTIVGSINGNADTATTATNVSGTVAIANGGTGATSASAARTALGLTIGTNVQAWDTDLDTWATKTAPTGTVVGTTDTQTLTNKTITNLVFDGFFKEDVFTITDGASVDLNPSNGTVQLWTLGASRSPTATNFVAGQSMTLMVNDGTAYTITWPSVTWVGGSAPTLATTGYTVIELWEVGTTLYGALVGSVA